MSLAVFKESHLTAFGNQYFVANSQVIHIGSYGKKATPIIGQNKLEPKGHILATKLDGKIHVVPPITLDSANSKKSDFTGSVSADLKVFGFSGSVSTVYDELVKTHLKMVELYVEENAMKNAANDSPQVLDNLGGYGSDARIAHRIFVVMEADFATSFTGATSWEVTGSGGSLSVKASGGSAVAGKDNITLSASTTIAYLLLKLDWENGKSRIKETHVDEWSFN